MNDLLLSALSYLKPNELSYDEWLRVGMALKQENVPRAVWDEWSKDDPRRYQEREFSSKWRSFQGCGRPVTGATIVQMAKDRGWKPYEGDGAMDWDDAIARDGGDAPAAGTEPAAPPEDGMKPAEELAKYIRTLFRPEDRVGYVTGDVYRNEDGSWKPLRGVFTRTAGELLASLAEKPDDLRATVGDWQPEAGAWIRFNPLDGNGIADRNVTRFRYALVESDTVPVQEQIDTYRKLELPVACLVSSAGKSAHAIVRIDAPDEEEYRKRVQFLYEYLASRGVPVDQANKNPSRLSRMPGVDRNGKRQRLLAVNIGRRTWQDWKDFIEGVNDGLPALESLSDFTEDRPALPDELIGGILRRGHKMLISGSSKAGKSFLLMELAVAIAEGRDWLGFPCRKGRVLYVNLEIDRASCIDRFLKIYEASGIPREHPEDVCLWNLRGKAVPLNELVPNLVRRVRDQRFDAIIIDPIYKVITGDENNATDMARFCNQFDRICAETGCAAIYCHHHSKGAQGNKDAKDRASGSGVFARDPDAQLDMIELQLDSSLKYEAEALGRTAWRLESSLREFPNITPVDFWFDCPIHTPAVNGELSDASARGTTGRHGDNREISREQNDESIRMAYTACSIDTSKPVTVADLAGYLGISERTVRDRLKDMAGEFVNVRGSVYTI